MENKGIIIDFDDVLREVDPISFNTLYRYGEKVSQVERNHSLISFIKVLCIKYNIEYNSNIPFNYTLLKLTTKLKFIYLTK